MNILILGSGGREHALAWKIAQSPKTDHLYIGPGNAGTALVGTNAPIDATDFENIKTFVIEKAIDMLVVGPEVPLVNGIHDFFQKDLILNSIPVIGPESRAAQLEGSKDFAKSFMKKHGIPTAASETFQLDSLEKGKAYLESLKPPYVLKADGLAGGKGVLILKDLDEAKTELESMLRDSPFGEASSKVVIEEFLDGIELSVFILTDGIDYKILPVAKDYKRIGEGDTGLNTGGMGSISPVPFATEAFMQKVDERIIKPTLLGMQDDRINYQGFLFFGLIKVGEDPYVIEYNCRMGDPETESVIPRIKSDFVDLLEGVANGNLSEKNLVIDDRYAASVMLVSKGYPGKYEVGKTIKGINNLNNCILFYAGASNDVSSGNVKTSGGRVMVITTLGESMGEALKNAYINAEIIEFEGKSFRKDLGFDLK